MDTGFPEGMPLFFEVFFAVVLLVVIGGFFLTGAAVLRSRRVLREAGLDPLAAQAQIAARLARGPLGAPAKSLEQRLAELDDLHRRGVISDTEHATARTATLAEG